MEVELTFNVPVLTNDIKAPGVVDFTISNHDDHYVCNFVILAASSDGVARVRHSQMRHPPQLIIQSRHPFRHLKSFLNYLDGDPIEAFADNIFELEELATLFEAKSLMAAKMSGRMASMKNSDVNVTFGGRAWIAGKPRGD
jgi:hypothetical protein